MIDRRGFLQAFGIGAIAVPVVGGVPELQHTARIIEPPKVELVTAPKILDELPMEPFLNRTVCKTVVTMFDGKKTYRFTADSFITDLEREYVDVTSYYSQYREYVPGLTTVRYTLKGVVTGRP